MKFIKGPQSLDAWRYTFMCKMCESTLEADVNDINIMICDDQKTYCATCSECGSINDIDTKLIPHSIVDDALVHVKKREECDKVCLHFVN